MSDRRIQRWSTGCSALALAFAGVLAAGAASAQTAPAPDNTVE